jgi:hypothetical protein
LSLYLYGIGGWGGNGCPPLKSIDPERKKINNFSFQNVNFVFADEAAVDRQASSGVCQSASTTSTGSAGSPAIPNFLLPRSIQQTAGPSTQLFGTPTMKLHI